MIDNIILKLKLQNKEMYLEDILIAFQDNFPDKIKDLEQLMKVLGAIVISWRNEYKPLKEQHHTTLEIINKFL